MEDASAVGIGGVVSVGVVGDLANMVMAGLSLMFEQLFEFDLGGQAKVSSTYAERNL
ncbi:hypothetical protein ABWH93_06280 [Seohaeicola saemankumensis]|uniref:hypothetical protein n=1 Tax=Seohaeicola saemankumensis TaxID=481181 RepID=UPI0035D03046